MTSTGFCLTILSIGSKLLAMAITTATNNISAIESNPTGKVNTIDRIPQEKNLRKLNALASITQTVANKNAPIITNHYFPLPPFQFILTIKRRFGILII